MTRPHVSQADRDRLDDGLVLDTDPRPRRPGERMTTDYYTVTISDIDGEPMLCSAALALMFGVNPTDVSALPAANGKARIPREWLQRGRRRTREAAAHTGSAEFDDVLRYWARRDHNAELRVVLK